MGDRLSSSGDGGCTTGFGATIRGVGEANDSKLETDGPYRPTPSSSLPFVPAKGMVVAVA